VVVDGENLIRFEKIGFPIFENRNGTQLQQLIWTKYL
jgi:hypothetical protein